MKKNASFAYAALLLSACAAVCSVLTACGNAPDPDAENNNLFAETTASTTIRTTFTTDYPDPSVLSPIAHVYAVVPPEKTYIRIYEKPETDSKVVVRLLRNDELSVLQKQNGWLCVRFGKFTGWIQTTDVSSFPMETETTETTTEPEAEIGYISMPNPNESTAVYEKADMESKQLAQAAHGDVIGILSEADGWCLVRFGEDVQGYIPARFAARGTMTTATTTLTTAVTTAATVPETTPAPSAPVTEPPVTAAPPATAAPTVPAVTAAPNGTETNVLIPASELWGYVPYAKTANMRLNVTDLMCNNGQAVASHYDSNYGMLDTVTAIYITNVRQSVGSVSVMGTLEVQEIRTRNGRQETVVIDTIPFSIVKPLQ